MPGHPPCALSSLIFPHLPCRTVDVVLCVFISLSSTIRFPYSGSHPISSASSFRFARCNLFSHSTVRFSRCVEFSSSPHALLRPSGISDPSKRYSQESSFFSHAFCTCVLPRQAFSIRILTIHLRFRSDLSFPAMFDLGCWTRYSRHQVVSPFSPALPFSLERR